MRIRKQLSLTGLTLAFSLILAAAAQAQTATCVVIGSADTQNRKVLAPNQGVNIAAECGSGHSAPWGNWGVSSNVGGVRDGDQFQGWKCKPSGFWLTLAEAICPDASTGTKCGWNSCTSEFPPPDCTRYNYSNCTQQITTTGINTHGVFSTLYYVSCPRELLYGGWMGGCLDIAGTAITLNQNFMTLYELDPCDEDELVQSLYFPSRSAILASCDPWFCPLVASPWANPTSYDDPVWPPLVYAQMAIAVRAELWDDPPYGDCDGWNCPACDPGGWCPPCVPTCFDGPCDGW